jgi:uncharacterized protein (TIGR03435 family)
MLKVSFAALVVTLGGRGWGQATVPAAAAVPIAYDAVSIRVNNSGSGAIRFMTGTDSITLTNIPLKQLLVNAYGIREGLISELPAWAENARFDVNAKILDRDPAELKKITNEQRRAMMAALLEERFHVKVHVEVKTLPVYELVCSKDGPKFKETTALPFDPNADPATRRSGKFAGSMMTRPGEMTFTGVELSALTSNLEGQVERNVIDKTGLTGKYDIHLRWLPDNAPPPMLNGAPDPDPPPPLFTALQEQLGLKLVAAKGPVKTLVVDRVEMPTEN